MNAVPLVGGYLAGLIPPWFKWLALAFLCAFCFGAGVHHADKEWQAKWTDNELKQAQARQAEIAREIQAAKDQDREDLHHAEKRADAAVAAAGAADRLRQRAEAYARSASAAAPVVGEAASSPGLVLADLSGSLAEEARRNAAFADEAWDAAEPCAKRYDSLTPTAP